MLVLQLRATRTPRVDWEFGLVLDVGSFSIVFHEGGVGVKKAGA